MVKKITYFDVEYANSKNKSICQIGISCSDFYTGDPIYPEMSIMINPEDGFDDNCIKIHGITPQQVLNYPNFKKVWKEIEKYFTNAIIVGHNVASSDLNALVKNLYRYNLDIPELYYICTYELSRKYIASYMVSNYKLSTLCEYFEIDVNKEHDAFDDACACEDLFKALLEHFKFNINNEVNKYNIDEINEFISYISNPILRKQISDFYGVIRGFSIDNLITLEEKEYIKNWKKEFSIYESHQEIKEIILTIDEILRDDFITNNEIIKLQTTIQKYLDNVNTSAVALSTQILNGIMKGIIVDKEVSELEMINLRQWLYDNIYLKGHYPFDRLLKLIEEILSDGIVGIEELQSIIGTIESILNPVEELKCDIYSVKDKIVCLSGDFEYGSKDEVSKYIEGMGGKVVPSVTKKVDLLIMGSFGSQKFSQINYGSKFLKAKKYIEQGTNIIIINEKEIFKKLK